MAAFQIAFVLLCFLISGESICRTPFCDSDRWVIRSDTCPVKKEPVATIPNKEDLHYMMTRNVTLQNLAVIWKTLKYSYNILKKYRGELPPFITPDFISSVVEKRLRPVLGDEVMGKIETAIVPAVTLTLEVIRIGFNWNEDDDEIEMTESPAASSDTSGSFSEDSNQEGGADEIGGDESVNILELADNMEFNPSSFLDFTQLNEYARRALSSARGMNRMG